MLAAGQLLLCKILVVTCCSPVAFCFCDKKDAKEICDKCCCCCCDQLKSRRRIGSVVSATKALFILLSLAELIWMILDFVEIAINGKLDGDGCFLSDVTIILLQNIAISTLELGS